MTFPDIHSNGTSPESLIESYSKAFDSLQLAYDDLKQTAPNGRDHYLSNTFEQAVREHMARLQAIHNVMDQLENLIGGIEEVVRR